MSNKLKLQILLLHLCGVLVGIAFGVYLTVRFLAEVVR